MKRKHIVVIEDEENIQELIAFNLKRDGFLVTCEYSGEAGLNRVRKEIPDLIVLDLMLPGMDGLEVCRHLKMGVSTRMIPIIIISAKGEESDVIAGLELGAEDYVTKPFSPKVLSARIRTVLRRDSNKPITSESPVIVHDLTIDPQRFQVMLKDKSIKLTKHEFRLLHFLARHPGWVFTRYQIVNGIRGQNYVVTERAVDVQIVGLRKKLGECADYIETVRGVGYRFKERE